jgi:RHH-type rel operon transcriptional repressor/antitoxin RelB
MGKLLNVRLSDDISDRLEVLSKKTKRTKSFYIRELIDTYFDEIEDSYLALERLNNKNAKYHSTDEVKKELGL